MLLTRLDRSAVLEIVLSTILMLAAMFLAISLGASGLWLYIIIGAILTAGGIWLEHIFRRLKRRQESR